MSKSKIKKFKGLYYYYQIVCPDGVRRPIYFAKGTTEKQFVTCRNKIDCMLQALRLGFRNTITFFCEHFSFILPNNHKLLTS